MMKSPLKPKSKLKLQFGTLVVLALAALSATTQNAHALLIGRSANDQLFTLIDNGSLMKNLGFNFAFFGNTYTSAYVNSNGNLTFGAGDTTRVDTGFPIGGPSAPVGTRLPRIAPFFDDLGPGNHRINNSTVGQFVSIWDNKPLFGTPANRFVTAETVLFGAGNSFGYTPGTIAFSYDGVGGVTNDQGTATATVGLNAGDNVRFSTLFPFSGNLNGTHNEIQARGLSNRTFYFTPLTPGGATGYAVSQNAPSLGGTAPVPEPGTLSLMALGLTSMVGAARRKKKQKDAAGFGRLSQELEELA